VGEIVKNATIAGRWSRFFCTGLASIWYLTPPAIWTPVSTNAADSIDGTWQFTDAGATNYTQRFYRSGYRP
jgi:hypothetical protein